jgi:hypothetical protein
MQLLAMAITVLFPVFPMISPCYPYDFHGFLGESFCCWCTTMFRCTLFDLGRAVLTTWNFTKDWNTTALYPHGISLTRIFMDIHGYSWIFMDIY